MKKYLFSILFTALFAVAGLGFAQNADAAVVNDPETGFSSVKTDYAVAVMNDAGATLYDSQGNELTGRKLADGSLWYTDFAQTRLSDGQVFYRVSTDEFVSEKDVTTMFAYLYTNE